MSISIHALREEGDLTVEVDNSINDRVISIHALREEGDETDALIAIFQDISIHALREEGDEKNHPHKRQRRISIHALREEGDLETNVYGTPKARISIHALREEGDQGSRTACRGLLQFLSTPSARRATPPCGCCWSVRQISIHALREEGDQAADRFVIALVISIHALREEGDSVTLTSVVSLVDFYPRPPRGGRQQKQRQNLYFLINYTTFCTNLEEP